MASSERARDACTACPSSTRQYPGFPSPYVIATVETAEGVRFNTSLVGEDVANTPIGSDLVAVFDADGEALHRPQIPEDPMTSSFITYEKRDRVAVVTLNRPESMNALHLEAHLELKEAWEDFRDDPDLWVAILTGAGDRAFCAGNDLKVTADRTATGWRRSGRGATARSAGSPGTSTARSPSSRR